MKKIAYIGVDYHMNSVTMAVLVENEKDISETVRMKNQDSIIKKYLKRQAKQFELRICYEASSSGFEFKRKMDKLGYHCDVIAPSLIPKKAGDRRKNDHRDAQNLARLYAHGVLTTIHTPTEEEEGIRSFIRGRQALKSTVKHFKQMINSHILSYGFRWAKSKWTIEHRRWLSNILLPDKYSKMMLDEYLNQLGILEARVEAMDHEIKQIAATKKYESDVKKLCAIKGIGINGAMLLIAEISDFKRFASPKAMMAYIGLVPSEDSSGDRRRGGPITKAGNKRCRTQLIESVQYSRYKPAISGQMKKKLAATDPRTTNIAVKCMHRLHKRFWLLVNKGKSVNKAKTAVAREMVGFIWSIMHPEAA